MDRNDLKDRNGMDLTEQKILRRGGKNTQKSCIYIYVCIYIYLHDPDNDDAHLEPDILKCKVKMALGSITKNKAIGGDGIPVELFQILKDDFVKVLHSICQQIWKTQRWPQDWKRSVFIPIPKKCTAEDCSDSRTIALKSHTSKAVLKLSKPGSSST